MSLKRDIVERLQRYLDGTLEPEAATQLEGQLAREPELRRTLNLLRAMRQTRRPETGLEEAARGLIDRLVKDMDRRRENARHGLLTFDSALLPLPAGIRPATLDSRRLRYTAEGMQVEMSVYPASAGTFEVIGQVEGYEAGVELEVSLVHGRRSLKERTNRFQVFHFTRVEEGSYVMAVTDPAGTRFELALDL